MFYIIKKKKSVSEWWLTGKTWFFPVINCNCRCVSGDCSGFHVAAVPNSDLGSLSAAVRAAPSHLGAHTGRQTKVSNAHRKSWFSLLWWNWSTVNVSWCCVCVSTVYLCLYMCVSSGVITEQESVWTWGRWSLISPVSFAKTRSG